MAIILSEKFSDLMKRVFLAGILLGSISDKVLSASTRSSSPQSSWHYGSVSPNDCPRSPNLTPEYWTENDFDSYLRNYPSGNTLTFPEYVSQISPGSSFQCGMGKFCQVKPICEEVRGPDWYILYATSQWNRYVNSLAKALRSSTRICKEIVPEILEDFLKNYYRDQPHGVINELDLIRAIFLPIAAGGSDSDVEKSTQIPDWTAAVSPIRADGNRLDIQPHDAKPSNDQAPSATLPVTETTPSDKAVYHLPEDSPSSKTVSESEQVNSGGYRRKVKRQLLSPEIPMIYFNSTQTVEENLDQTSSQFHNLLTRTITEKLNSPISLDEGIYSSLKGGRFLVNKLQLAGIISRAKEAVSLIAISGLLNYEKAAIIVKKSHCHKYRDSLKFSEDQLEFCASDGTFIEIVKIEGNEINKKFHNAHLIKDKYGFSTSFLASEAWKCSQVRSGANVNEILSEDDFDACTFDIPLCDLTKPENQHKLNNGESLIQICTEETKAP